MSGFAAPSPTALVSTFETKVALSDKQVRLNHRRVAATQHARFRDWEHRNEEYATDRTYHLPRIHELYSRVLITPEQRDALHVTRKTLEAVTKHSFLGSQGLVAQFSWVTSTMEITITDELLPAPQTPGERSLRECMQLLRDCSYNISEGPSFIRTPLILPKLEEKYYISDLQTY